MPLPFEVGDRSGETFLRWHEWLPEAERCYGDDYGVYGSWLPAERRIVGKGQLANRNEAWGCLRSIADG